MLNLVNDSQLWVTAVNWIDDVNIIMIEKLAEKNCITLHIVYSYAEQ